MNKLYQLMPELFLRAPFYSFAGYDLDWLPQVLEEETFRNAIWLASPVFYNALAAKNFLYELLNEKEKLTLHKYYNRMCFRPTPFGSFASFTFLKWGNSSTVRLSDPSRSLLHLHPDFEFLLHFNNKQNVNLVALNPTVYRFDQEFRFIKSAEEGSKQEGFRLEAIAAEKLNIQLFAKLKKNAACLGELTTWLAERSGSTVEDAEDYLAFLLEEQVLYAPSRTGLIGRQNDWVADNMKKTLLLETGSIAKISAEIAASLSSASGGEHIQPFYAAFERLAESEGPGSAERIELEAAFEVLQKLSYGQTLQPLKNFAADFQARFDQQKVPLLLALDPDHGIPYGNLDHSAIGQTPMRDIFFPQTIKDTLQIHWNATHRLLFRLMVNASEKDKYGQVTIRTEDLQDMKMEEGLVPPVTQAVMYRKTQEHLVIDFAGGAAATSLLGRFSLFNGQIAAFCWQLAEIEKKTNPGIIFADIDQLSKPHTDNINRREKIYSHRIPINVFNAENGDDVILPGDLLLSVKNGELLLESKSRGKRVIPRLSTAFNYYHNELGIFRFLCDLQFQGLGTVRGLDLEELFPGLEFYPRIVFQDTIISVAKWKVNNDQLLKLLENSADVQNALKTFRRQAGIPARVSMGEADQQLVFDLAVEQEGLFFMQCVKGLKKLTLYEHIYPAKDVKAGNKPLAAQRVAFFFHNLPIYSPLERTVSMNKNAAKRDFQLGTNWLYLKVFCTPQAADRLLSMVIHPFITAQKRYIKNWFFIRYTENGNHLRLRFQTDEAHIGLLLVKFNDALKASPLARLVRDYLGDTYKRELERYGPKLIELAEEVFHAGSELSCFWLSPVNERGKIDEFRHGLMTAYYMVECFLPDHAQRLLFISGVLASFVNEFGSDKQLKIAMDKKYRQLRLDLSIPENDEFALLLSKIKTIADSAKSLTKYEQHNLLSDLVHMQMNRNFNNSQRQQEYLVYYFIGKLSNSIAARKKQMFN